MHRYIKLIEKVCARVPLYLVSDAEIASTTMATCKAVLPEWQDLDPDAEAELYWNLVTAAAIVRADCSEWVN